jgi:flagellar hook assembly protein FlgD
MRLDIYDANGRRVRQLGSSTRPVGEQTIAWDLRDESGRAVQAGLYFARLEVDGRVLTQKFATLR